MLFVVILIFSYCCYSNVAIVACAFVVVLADAFTFLACGSSVTTALVDVVVVADVVVAFVVAVDVDVIVATNVVVVAIALLMLLFLELLLLLLWMKMHMLWVVLYFYRC